MKLTEPQVPPDSTYGTGFEDKAVVRRSWSLHLTNISESNKLGKYKRGSAIPSQILLRFCVDSEAEILSYSIR